MEINPETIQKIAHLARLELHPLEQEAMARELAQVLEWMNQLNEIDTSAVTPLQHLSAEINCFREDVVQSFWSTSEALKNAPQIHETYWVVPKVIEN
ncbi:MAG: Asp-tRNA(Asn)/Glu-tRNA(Gln) amidotransferase subunit GatC [Microscillaceae bacterium]|nr:Asp-tRNA(Asn)/Glu-tRNA(Gln) amidotransferase subunit GatC [Microscillaceae bacterium]MDW8461349.1 Asp-tRNA(Asn)/Glu-tRNA(Gln) amidotransferase subunit GatC [Cytophagales bacterium]